MEALQSEMTQATWDEWWALVREQECAECGSHLDIRTVPERAALSLSCAANPEHSGFRQRTNLTEDVRRGVDVHPVVQDKILARMMVPEDLHRAMNLLAVRFPRSIKDTAGAALFINDCMRLGLDPLIQPAEAVPVPFETKNPKTGEKKTTVAMVVTEDGALSMAARGCPDEYNGAPATAPLLDYLIRQYPERTLEELIVMVHRTAKDLCGDGEAWVWVALGSRRSSTSLQPVYGYYTKKEFDKAKQDNLPSSRQPGNQARIRAVKRWVRETFPEARQRMLEYTAEIARRTGGTPTLDQIIDAEYTVITEASNHTPLKSPASAGKELARTTSAHESARTSKPARTQRAKTADNKVGEPAKRSPGPQSGQGLLDIPGEGQGGDPSTPAAPSGAAEHTLLSTGNASEIATPREAAAGNGFSIDMAWVRACLIKMKWSDGTARSWIKSLWPEIDTSGDLKIVISRLSRSQAESFAKELDQKSS